MALPNGSPCDCEGGLAVTLATVEDVHELSRGSAVVLGSPVYDGRETILGALAPRAERVEAR